MRTVWFALILAVMAAGTTGYAQESRPGKARSRHGRNNALWAVSYTGGDGVMQVLPQTPPQLPAAAPTPPAATLAPVPHSAPQVVFHPPAEPDHGCGHDEHCGKKGKCKDGGHRLLDWICYRPRGTCAKGCGCCYFCSPPPYLYLLQHCREGACHDVREPTPCPKGCGWGKIFQTGHRMFAMPTGHGCCGVR